MISQILTKSDASNLGFDFITNVDCGAIKSGTELHASDTLQDTVKSMLLTPPPHPNERYESKSLGTWSSTTDVNNFLSKYNHENDYIYNYDFGDYISLGNYVTINDGTYNREWEIAGFDCEHNQTAADGTTYDNGYGILMIPKTYLSSEKWNSSNTVVPYINSTMHTSTLVTAANNMKNILGDHMINRNVLLGSAQGNQVSSSQKRTTSAYTWTTSYLTLMSIGQMNGKFGQYTSKYDDGEANYKLPLFDYEGFGIGSKFWSRCVWGNYGAGNFSAWCVLSDGSISDYTWVFSAAHNVRPLMLLR